MVRFSELEAMELIENKNPQQTIEHPPELIPEKVRPGYNSDLGVMGQPASFYVGILCGLLLHVCIAAYVWSRL